MQLACATRVAFGNEFEELPWRRQEGLQAPEGGSPTLIQPLCPHTPNASVLPYTGPLSGGNSVRTPLPPRTGFSPAGFRRARGANTQFGGSQSPRRGRRERSEGGRETRLAGGRRSRTKEEPKTRPAPEVSAARTRFAVVRRFRSECDRGPRESARLRARREKTGSEVAAGPRDAVGVKPLRNGTCTRKKPLGRRSCFLPGPMRPFIEVRDDEARGAAGMDSMQEYQENGGSACARYSASERGVLGKDSGTEEEGRRRRRGRRAWWPAPANRMNQRTSGTGGNSTFRRAAARSTFQERGA